MKPTIILFLFLLTSCGVSDVEQQAVLETFTKYKTEIKNNGTPEKYITKNSIEFFNKALLMAKKEPKEIWNHVQSFDEKMTIFRLMLLAHYGFVKKAKPAGDEQKAFQTFLMSEGFALWTKNISDIENIKIQRFSSTFLGHVKLHLRSRNLVRYSQDGEKKIYTGAPMLMKKEDGIWKIDIESSIAFYENEKRGWLHVNRSSDYVFQREIIEYVEEKFSAKMDLALWEAF